MGEDAQCCRRVTCFPPAEAGTISPKSGESSTTVLGDDTETTIGPLGSAQATLMYIRTGLISSLQRNIMWFKLSVKVLFLGASAAHLSFSCVFCSLQVLAYIQPWHAVHPRNPRVRHKPWLGVRVAGAGANCRREHDAILWVTLRSALLAVPDLLRPVALDVIGAQNNGLKTVSTKGCGRRVTELGHGMVCVRYWRRGPLCVVGTATQVPKRHLL